LCIYPTYYLGGFDISYIIFKNVEFFWIFFFQICFFFCEGKGGGGDQGGGKKKTMCCLFMEIPNYKKTVLHYFAFRYLFFPFKSINFLKFCCKLSLCNASQFDDFSTGAWLRVELSSSTVELVSCRVLLMTWFRGEPSSSTLHRCWFHVVFYRGSSSA
jgi:hypothetical protein